MPSKPSMAGATRHKKLEAEANDDGQLTAMWACVNMLRDYAAIVTATNTKSGSAEEIAAVSHGVMQAANKIVEAINRRWPSPA